MTQVGNQQLDARRLVTSAAMQSKAATVAEYLKSLPEDRRRAVEAVRDAFRRHLDKDIEEGMNYGMIGWFVPHRVFPQGYHCNPKQPLPFAGLASQKNHLSLYLMWTYEDTEEEAWLRDAWTKDGRKLDMGKCCIRFKKLEDVPLEVVAEAVRRMPAKKFVAWYEALLDPRTGKAKSTGAAASAKKPAKAATKSAPAKPAPAKKTASKKAGAKTTGQKPSTAAKAAAPKTTKKKSAKKA